MRICEIFKSIDGEGINQGYPTTFIRFSGCNLSCSWCDTVYAHKEGTEMSLSEVISKIQEPQVVSGCIAITGGEPLLQQEDVRQILFRTCYKSSCCTVYTNGTIPINKDLFWLSNIVLDYKFEAEEKIYYSNIKEIGRTGRGVIKFVIKDLIDLCRMKRKIEMFESEGVKEFHVTPLYQAFDPATIANYVIDILPTTHIKVSLQQHKLIFGATRRGV